MNILFVSSEAVPYSKSGGLGDVAGALPKKIGGNENITLISPLYKNSHPYTGQTEKIREMKVSVGNEKLSCIVYEAEKSGKFRSVLISQELFFSRKYIYGSDEHEYHDNFFRFLFFQNAVIEFIKAEGEKYDIIHINDWQTSFIPALIKEDNSPLFNNVSTVLTIHNLGYQGIFQDYYFKETGLPEHYFTSETFEFYGKINSLKGGITLSDKVVTVSPNYSREIMTPEFGAGLDGILNKFSGKVSGILNGADYDVWNPATDRFIYKQYSFKDLNGKKINKESLFSEFNIPFKTDDPLVVSVTRLAQQKGIDLLIDSIRKLNAAKINFIILGTGERHLSGKLEKLAKNNSNLVFFNTFDEKLSHKLFAAGDMFAMPSLYEPCGLSQLYALKYGTVPIVTSTGGLKDTVDNITERSGTGFILKENSSEALLESLKEALTVFSSRAEWIKIVKRGMEKDFSWEKPGTEYLKVYKKLLKER